MITGSFNLSALLRELDRKSGRGVTCEHRLVYRWRNLTAPVDLAADLSRIRLY